MPEKPEQRRWFEQWLCRIGRHDFEIIEVSFQFADSGCVEKLRCKRCGAVIVRPAK